MFGGYAFRKVNTNYNRTRKSSINKSLLVAVSVLLAAHSEYSEQTRVKELTPELAKLLVEDKDLSIALSWSTSSKKSISYVFECLKNKLFDKFLLSSNE